MKRLAIIAGAVVVWFAVSACGQNEPAKPARSAERREEYQKKIEAQLDELAKGIASLQAKAGQAGTEANARMQAMIAQMEQKREAAQKKLREMKGATAEAWAQMKADIDATMEDLKQSYERAISQLK